MKVSPARTAMEQELSVATGVAEEAERDFSGLKPVAAAMAAARRNAITATEQGP